MVLRLSVRTLTDSTLAVEVPDMEVTVLEIKKLLHAQIKAEIKSLNLVFQGEVLQDSDTLSGMKFKFPSDFLVVVYNPKKVTSDKRSSDSNILGRSKRPKLLSDLGMILGEDDSEMANHIQRMVRERLSARSDAKVVADPDSIQVVAGMGFSEEAAKKALLVCNNRIEAALNWLVEHCDSPNINTPWSPEEEQEKVRQYRQGRFGGLFMDGAGGADMEAFRSELLSNLGGYSEHDMEGDGYDDSSEGDE